MELQEFIDSAVPLKGEEVFKVTQDLAFYGRDDVEGEMYGNCMFLEFDNEVGDWALNLGGEVRYDTKENLQTIAYEVMTGERHGF